MAEYLVKPGEVLNMYSEALKILDENTVKYMVDEFQGEIKELKEKNVKLEEKIIDFERKQLEADVNIIINMKNNGFTIEQIAIATGKTEDEVKRVIEQN